MLAGYFALLCCLASVSVTSGLIEGLYCGRMNCYDVLEVDRSADMATIRKAYRTLAKQYHPDKYKGPDAQEKFRQVATAYEILKDEEERANYDYMLDHPEQVYRHYYHYYKKRVAPKVDVRVVIIVTLLVVSVIQYLGRWHSYNTAVKAALHMPRYRTRVKEIAQERGLLQAMKRKKIPKEELKAEEEAIFRSILEENLDITGGYSKPRIQDVLVIKIVISPYFLVTYIVWYAQWIWRFNIKKMEYGPEEKLYLIRRNLGISETQWNTLSEEQQQEILQGELWVKEHCEEYKKKQKEEMKVKMAESGKYKRYRRYMKSHKPGKLTFSD